jgi:formylmethanofuran dehydrogenase subunit E
MWTDDPIADFFRHDAKQEAWRKSRPECCKCGEHIQDEDAVCIDYEYYCDECLRRMRKRVGDD